MMPIHSSTGSSVAADTGRGPGSNQRHNQEQCTPDHRAGPKPVKE
ncbi:MAG TPA: hypothetical protein VNI81_05070 [Candidatus Limnocylindrales bacterium]|nr:hypothetical protein [Candidatus Limnocylindrales bacterium]